MKLLCPAKVNLALSVGPAEGSGYHPIASWMVALNFGDELTLSRRDAGASRWRISFDEAGPAAGRQVDWPLDRDLAVRAHGLAEREAGRTLPVDVTIAKRVPPGAGLGGGSSDAAAMLVALDELFKLGLGEARLGELAAELGSDVVFLVRALRGTPAALVTGRGQRIEPTPLAEPVHLALLLPAAVACPTAAVYAAFDELAGDGGELRVDRVTSLAHAGRVRGVELFNDLAEPAMRVRPQLATLRASLEQRLERPVHVTGSGAAMFVVAADQREAPALAQRVAETGQVAALAVQAPPTPTAS